MVESLNGRTKTMAQNSKIRHCRAVICGAQNGRRQEKLEAAISHRRRRSDLRFYQFVRDEIECFVRGY